MEWNKPEPRLMEWNKKNLGLTIGGIVAGLFVLFFIVGIRSVNPGHVGIVKTGGQVTGMADPGWNHVWWPVQSLDTVDLRTQKQQFSEIDASSQELQSVKLTGTITYHIDKAAVQNLYQTIDLTDIEQNLLQPALQDYVKEATPQYAATDILAHRSDIRNHALVQLDARLATNYPGIVVTDIFISNIDYSAQYQAAIEAKQVAQQQVATSQQQQDKAKIDAQTAVITAQGVSDANAKINSSLSPQLIQYLEQQKWDGKLPQVTGGATPFIQLPTK